MSFRKLSLLFTTGTLSLGCASRSSQQIKPNQQEDQTESKQVSPVEEVPLINQPTREDVKQLPPPVTGDDISLTSRIRGQEVPKDSKEGVLKILAIGVTATGSVMTNLFLLKRARHLNTFLKQVRSNIPQFPENWSFWKKASKISDEFGKSDSAFVTIATSQNPKAPKLNLTSSEETSEVKKAVDNLNTVADAVLPPDTIRRRTTKASPLSAERLAKRVQAVMDLKPTESPLRVVVKMREMVNKSLPADRSRETVSLITSYKEIGRMNVEKVKKFNEITETLLKPENYAKSEQELAETLDKLLDKFLRKETNKSPERLLQMLEENNLYKNDVIKNIVKQLKDIFKTGTLSDLYADIVYSDALDVFKKAEPDVSKVKKEVEAFLKKVLLSTTLVEDLQRADSHETLLPVLGQIYTRFLDSYSLLLSANLKLDNTQNASDALITIKKQVFNNNQIDFEIFCERWGIPTNNDSAALEGVLRVLRNAKNAQYPGSSDLQKIVSSSLAVIETDKLTELDTTVFFFVLNEIHNIITSRVAKLQKDLTSPVQAIGNAIGQVTEIASENQKEFIQTALSAQ